jgi:hypothetical protein
VAIYVKSDWTHEHADLAERSRGSAQRVEDDGDVLLTRLARSVVPAILSGDELERLAERAIEPTRCRELDDPIGNASRPLSRSTRSPSSARFAAQSTSWRAQRAA